MSTSRASAMGHMPPPNVQLTQHILLSTWIVELFSYRKRTCWAREPCTGRHASSSFLCQLHNPNSAHKYVSFGLHQALRCGCQKPHRHYRVLGACTGNFTGHREPRGEGGSCTVLVGQGQAQQKPQEDYKKVRVFSVH